MFITIYQINIIDLMYSCSDGEATQNYVEILNR